MKRKRSGKKSFFKKWLVFLLLTTVYGYGFSQEPALNLYDLSFDELSKLKVTSATKSEQGLNEIPATIRIVTGSEIMERGYLSLDEVLSDLPGFQFRNIMSMNSYVFQRGIPNQNNLTLVLIDGIQTNELNSGGFYGGSQYNLSNIERIEVIYGPASVAYGTNAVSGIINIITKKPDNEQGYIGAYAGSFNTLKTDAGYHYSNQLNTFGVSISGMVMQSEKANLKGIDGDHNWTDLLDNFENDRSFDVKIRYKEFTLGTDYMNKQTSTSTTRKTAGTPYRDYGSLWNIRFINNYLKYEKKLTTQWSVSASLYNRNATVLNNTVYYVTDSVQVGYYRPNNLTGAEGIISYHSGKSASGIAGVLFEYEQLANGPSLTYSNSADIAPPAPEKPSMQNNYLFSLFVEPTIYLFKNMVLSGGIRFDQSSIYNQVVTPRAGLKYSLKNFSAGLLYAEAFRAPKPWDYTDGLGNPGLLPEKIRSLEAIISTSIARNFSIESSLYNNILLNGFTKETIEESYRWINRSVIQTQGVEISFRYTNPHFHANANYTFNYSTDESGIQIPEIAMHCANASVCIPMAKSFHINLRANYSGKRENPKMITATGSNYIDPYLIFNGAIAWFPINGLSIRLIGKNLLNTEYYHTSNRDPERYRQPQRTLLLSVSYSFNKQS